MKSTQMHNAAFSQAATEVTFLRQPEVLRRLANMPKSTYNAGVKTGRYPAPIKLSERSAAYKKDEIDLCCLMLAEGFCWRERHDEAWVKRYAEITASNEVLA
jgi:predicted DNA-binding transcriptional regulator AlpA